MTIGVFDSGVGGLWILKHLRENYPRLDYIFVADQAHVPYGTKTIEEIRNFSENISKFLIEQSCELIVVACNTASGASLNYLRQKFPEIIFVGMEPALKPAVLNSQTKKVGILATQTTFQGELYGGLKEKYGGYAQIFEDPCLGLVSQIEKGELDSLSTEKILQKAISPMLENGVDEIVLGCTHYPFVIPLIRKIVGEGVEIIDPTEAIVRRVGELIRDKNGSGQMQIFTTGDPEGLKPFLAENTNVAKIEI